MNVGLIQNLQKVNVSLILSTKCFTDSINSRKFTLWSPWSKERNAFELHCAKNCL